MNLTTENIPDIFEDLGGQFHPSFDAFAQRLSGIKAFLFDWDGVYNDGLKTGQGGSSFLEPDIMGTNMLRLGYWLKNEAKFPRMGILTGANNPAARRIVERESFDALFMGIKYKPAALDHFCQQHGLLPEQIAYVFDDINDLKVAQMCGLRCLVRRDASPVMSAYAHAHHLYDYRTAHPGGQHAVRELCELMLACWGVFEEVVSHRTAYDQTYQTYLLHRNKAQPSRYVEGDKGEILPQPAT